MEKKKFSKNHIPMTYLEYLIFVVLWKFTVVKNIKIILKIKLLMCYTSNQKRKYTVYFHKTKYLIFFI